MIGRGGMCLVRLGSTSEQKGVADGLRRFLCAADASPSMSHTVRRCPSEMDHSLFKLGILKSRRD